MAELTSEKRKGLSDSAFAIVKTEDGKKVRKYPVEDEAHQKAALSHSHGARSGKPASASEHRAVHAAVGRRNKTMLAQHMKDEHGGGALKRAFDGLVTTLSPATRAVQRASPLARFKRRQVPGSQPGQRPGRSVPPSQPAERTPTGKKVPPWQPGQRKPWTSPLVSTTRLPTRMAKGAVVGPDTYASDGSKWQVVNKAEKKVLSTHADREAAVKALVDRLAGDENSLDDLCLVHVIPGRSLVEQEMTTRSYGR